MSLCQSITWRKVLRFLFARVCLLPSHVSRGHRVPTSRTGKRSRFTLIFFLGVPVRAGGLKGRTPRAASAPGQLRVTASY